MPHLLKRKNPDSGNIEWAMVSETNGHVLKWFGKTKPGKKKELHEERRVQFFKNLEHSTGGPGSLRAKVKNKSLLKD